MKRAKSQVNMQDLIIMNKKKNIFDTKEFNLIIFFECKVNFLKMNSRE